MIGEEIVGVKTLYEKDLAKKPRLIALQHIQAETGSPVNWQGFGRTGRMIAAENLREPTET